jgi:hypothetical protein
MIDAIIDKAKGMITSPVETFRKSRDDEVTAMLKYFAVIVLIHAIFATIVALLLGSHGTYQLLAEMEKQLGLIMPLVGAAGIVVSIIIIEILAIFFLLIISGWVHIFVYLFGGKKGYLMTVKAFAYASTPSMLIGWIPVIGFFIGWNPVIGYGNYIGGFFIGGFWSLILGIIGIREYQQISTARAAGAMLVAIIILVILFILFAAFLLFSIMSIQTAPMAFQG